jgi:DNA ligase (NAD+)
MPEITDAEFDELVDELTGLDKDNPVLIEVGAIPAWGRKVKHPSLMGSLSKATSSEELKKWADQLDKWKSPPVSQILVSYKVDGLAVRLRYKDGKLVEGATRGDGSVGQDILQNVIEIDGIPKHTTDDTFSGEVRGEVYMPKKVWESFGSQFANPRNGASGALLQKDPQETRKRKLSFMAYYCMPDDKPLYTEKAMRECAERNGFHYVEFFDDFWNLQKEDDVDETLEQYALDRPRLPYQIDGLVLTFNSLEFQEELGWNGKRPRGKVAYKFPAEQQTAEAIDMIWQVGRTGKLTPVLHIEPTYIDGSTVSKMSIASAGRFTELGLAKGDVVLVEKAGDIIPQVVRVVQHSNGIAWKYPQACRSCGGGVEMEGAHLYCRNTGCQAQLSRNVLHWLDRMDVKGVGPGIVNALCYPPKDGDRLVSELVDLYHLDPAEIAVAIGSKKTADKIYKEIMYKSQVPLWRFLSALGISSLGRTASKAIAKRLDDGFPGISVAKKIDAIGPAWLSRVDGIGQQTAQTIHNGLADSMEQIRKLEKVLEITEESSAGGVLSGKSFCLTGAMSRNRKEIAADIEKSGGEIKSSVGKGLNFLVQADPTSTSSKTVKAEKYGTEIISEEQLLEMMGV